MENVGIELLHRFFVSSKLVQKGYLLEHKVIALSYQLWIFLQESETLGVWLLQTLVELVKFHENSRVCLIETEGFLHHSQCLFLTILLVESCQSQIAPYTWEGCIEFRRALPVGNGHIILTFVVVQTAQIIWSLSTVRVQSLGALQCEDVIQTIRETTVRIGLFCLLKALLGFQPSLLTHHRQGKAHVIIGHRMILGIFHLEHVDTLLPKTSLSIVESKLVIVIYIAVHKLDDAVQRLLITRQEMFLQHTAVVEAIFLIRLLKPQQSLLISFQLTQNGSLQGTSLVVIAVERKGALHLIECILITAFTHTDACSLEVTCICPSFVPC